MTTLTNSQEGPKKEKELENLEVQQKVGEIVDSIKQSKVPLTTFQALDKKFIFSEEVAKVLDLSYDTGENVILFGRGGYGKSEMTELFFNNKKITPFIKTMGSGTTTDVLFGGINIPLFNDTGKIEFLVENSFMNHEYVIFEELFDAPDYILEQLKDILTSKMFRNGTQMFEIKTKIIVCCTNKTREEFSKNDSLKALMERFPLEYKVDWEIHSQETYSALFRKVFGKSYDGLAYILGKLVQNQTIVSPRTAVKAAKIVDKCGIECLDYIADFGGKNKAVVRVEVEKYKNIEKIKEISEKIEEQTVECSMITFNSIPDIKKAKSILKNIKTLTSQLQTLKLDEEMVQGVNNKIKKYEKYIKFKNDAIENALKEENA